MIFFKKFAFFLFIPSSLFAQVYHFSDGDNNHRIIMDDSYLIETVYQQKMGPSPLLEEGFIKKAKKALKSLLNLILTMHKTA